MSKDHVEIEKQCFVVTEELTALINMEYINSLVQLHKEKSGKEVKTKIIRPALVDLKNSFDSLRELFYRLLRQNKKSDAKYLLVALESNLQHFLNYYLPQTILYDYIINNWNGKYRALIFQKSSPKLIYHNEYKNLVINKKLFNEGAITFFHECLQLCWENAWENLIELKEEFVNLTQAQKPAGRKKRRPSMEQIYSKDWLNKDIEKLKNVEYISFNRTTGKWEWNKSMKELSKYFWKASKNERFNEGFKNPERGAAFLNYFSIKETKANLYYFSTGYFKANFSGTNRFSL
jgi:hypothetical protein